MPARLRCITDNRKGGFYGYCASKAVLNMLKTAAIELPHCFSAGVTKLLEPDVFVVSMMDALQNLQTRQGAHFIEYQGKEIPL